MAEHPGKIGPYAYAPLGIVLPDTTRRPTTYVDKVTLAFHTFTQSDVKRIFFRSGTDLISLLMLVVLLLL